MAALASRQRIATLRHRSRRRRETLVRYDYTRLLVADFRACFRFYRDVIGLAPRHGNETDAYAEFETGGTAIAIFDRAEMSAAVGTSALPARAEAQDAVCIVFRVDDVDATERRLVAAGVPIVMGPTDRAAWEVRTLHVRDPDGRLVELNAPLG
jgi:lactoylglutathione lyase